MMDFYSEWQKSETKYVTLIDIRYNIQNVSLILKIHAI